MTSLGYKNALESHIETRPTTPMPRMDHDRVNAPAVLLWSKITFAQLPGSRRYFCYVSPV